MIAAIVAVDNDWGIGYQGQLLEHIPDDLKRFKQLTENNVVIMGENTWYSLPNRPLPNRENLVISYNLYEAENVKFVSMDYIKTILSNAKNYNKDLFVIGGGSIYQQLLEYCDVVYITKIYKTHQNIDTYFPNLDILSNEWKKIDISEKYNYKDIEYQFQQYIRL